VHCVGCLSVRSCAGDAPQLLALDAQCRVQRCEHAVVVPQLRDSALLLVKVCLELVKLCIHVRKVAVSVCVKV